MDFKSICVSLDTAMQLKKAGWQKETVFIWGAYAYTQDHDYDIKLETYEEWNNRLLSYGSQITSTHLRMPHDSCMAPTSSEIELFGNGIVMYDTVDKTYKGWTGIFGEGELISCEELEVEARAKLWLHLRKKGLL